MTSGAPLPSPIVGTFAHASLGTPPVVATVAARAATRRIQIGGQ